MTMRNSLIAFSSPVTKCLVKRIHGRSHFIAGNVVSKDEWINI